jgi:hypothetical protein
VEQQRRKLVNLAMDTRTIICGLVLATVWPSPAYAYRPFDGTDAGVAGPGEVELDLGYFHYLREGEQKSIVAPAAVVNFGLGKGNELVLEGRVRTHLNRQADERRTTFEDAALSFKQVHRNGVLQDAAGPSIASECGVLLPTVQGDRTGGSCGAILSHRWSAATVHFNAALGRNREGHWERFLGAIIEGPAVAAVRPVAESFVTRDSAGGHMNSALVGLIWTANEDLTFDIALRKAHTEEHGITEIRAGLTWNLPVHQGP